MKTMVKHSLDLASTLWCVRTLSFRDQSGLEIPSFTGSQAELRRLSPRPFVERPDAFLGRDVLPIPALEADVVRIAAPVEEGDDEFVARPVPARLRNASMDITNVKM